jgi:hypothetical protein
VRRRAVLALTTLGVLAACAAPAGDDAASGDPADSTAAGDITQADDDLQVTLDPGDGSPVQEWTLSCRDTPEGSHPGAGAACEHLSGMQDPFAPLGADAVCTEQYGGPETARVIGRWDGEPVDLELSRSDGCRIAQWDALGPLLAFDLD